MFEHFFHQIESELGPLHLDWFEELHEKKSNDGADVTANIASLCTEEELFRVPPWTPVSVPDTQTCSTPNLFRCQQGYLAEPLTEDSPDPGLQSPLPVPQGGESSPCLFGSAKDSQRFEKVRGLLQRDSGLDLLDTPKALQIETVSAQRISESLGAQLNPDLSWSSSLNTPLALSPTVILSKKEATFSPVSVRRENVVIVRKLFPSLSKDTTHHVAGVQIVERLSETSCDHWDLKQMVPDTIQDSYVHDMVEGVLGGADDVLSISFSNSGSALRKVKAKERVKRRVDGAPKWDETNSASVDQNMSPSEACKAVTADSVTSPLFNNFTQWTPLSLSEVQELNPASDHVAQHEEKRKFCADLQRSLVQAGLPYGSPTVDPHKKLRKFIYPVQSTASRRGVHTTAADSYPSPVTDSLSDKHLAHTDEGEAAVKQKNLVACSIEPDLDMTQLCKAFAEDFTQEIKSNINSTEDSSTSPCMGTEIIDMEVNLDIPRDAEAQNTLTSEPRIERTCKSPKYDSGCPANYKDSPSHNSGFATNRVIDTPPDAVTARTTLDDALECDNCVVQTSDFTSKATLGSVLGDVNNSGLKTESDKSLADLCVSLKNSFDVFKESDIQNAKEPNVSSQKTQRSTHSLDTSAILTASQKADISELCIILEKAGSQCEFTQAERTKLDSRTLGSSGCKKEWDSETFVGVDSDDGFSTELDRQALIKRKDKAGVGDATVQVSWSSNLREAAGCLSLADSEENVKEVSLCSGLETARENSVCISEKSLNRGKTLFEDLEDTGENFGALQSSAVTVSLSAKEAEQTTGKVNLISTVTQFQSRAVCCSFSTAGGKEVKISDKALQHAKKLLNDIEPATVSNKGFSQSTSLGKTFVRPSVALQDESLGKIKSSDETKPVLYRTPWLEQGGGFKTAGGKEVSISANAMEKSKAIFKDIESTNESLDEVTLKSAKSEAQKEMFVGGFKTASGKGVGFSEQALAKAKAFFKVCDDSMTAEQGCLNQGVLVLNESVQKAMGETSAETLPPTAGFGFSKPSSTVRSVPTDTLNTAKGRSEASFNKQGLGISNEKVILDHSWSFCTANGKKVEVSDEAMSKAKAFFTDCDGLVPDIQDPGRQATEEKPKDTMDGGSDLDHVESGFSTAKGVSVASSALKVASKMSEDRDAPSDHKHGQSAKPGLSRPSPATRDYAYLLNCRSLWLDGCTVTQQKYFEQEAMACTKALLEDDLAEHSLKERQSSSELDAGGRKKRMLENSTAGQPSPKRRLTSEFDQISVDRRFCAPVQSSPNGALRDRRVFKYNLKPAVTYPSRGFIDEKMNTNPKVSSEPKGPVFVPSFQKKPVAQRNPVTIDNARTPAVFVLPPNKSTALASSESHTSVLSSSRKRTEDEQMEINTDEKLENQNRAFASPGAKVSWQQPLELACDMQDMRIRKKKRQVVRPIPGTLYLTKTSGVSRIPLREAVGRACPVQHTAQEMYQRGICSAVSRITSQNAESFRFSWEKFFKHEALKEAGGVHLADGGWLIPDSKATLGKEEFYKALCDQPGVDPKLISEAWVYNHYRWIVWKRACMERTFPKVLGGRCLTPEQVLLQLKLRYDVEVDHSQRSALKRIIERDDTPAKTLVLCVCGIAEPAQTQINMEVVTDGSDTKTESSATVVWLTDGWYSVKALLDLPLSAMLRKGRLRVGGKLIIHGAELIGCQEACPPLEAPDSLLLKISANSTRRARWDTKMGFYKDPRPFPLSLSSLYPNGGAVGCVDVMVLRSYPTQWMEKKPGGVFVFRNERTEDREAHRHNSTKLKTVEQLFSQMEAQFEREQEEKTRGRRSRTYSWREVQGLQDGEELHNAMETDPALAEDHLSSQQVKALMRYRQDLAEKRRAELQERVHKAVQDAEGGIDRDVTPVWKLAIADSKDTQSKCVCILNIWRPSVELCSLLREGCRYTIYHLATSVTKKRPGIASIQFTATKNTKFQMMEVSPDWLGSHFPARQAARFRDIQDPAFSSVCGEVDVVGYVLFISDEQGASSVLYLVDERIDFVTVRTCGSLTHLALEELVKPLAPLSVSNVQLQPRSGSVPGLFAGEQALFSMQPKEAHIQEALTRLKTVSEGYEHFFIIAQEKLFNLIPFSVLNSCESLRSPCLQIAQETSGKSSKARVFSPFTPVSKNTPSLMDPRSTKRKRGLEHLSRIQPPPPLLPLGLVRSPQVSKTFNAPRRCKTLLSDKAPQQIDKQQGNDEELSTVNIHMLQEG